MQKRPRHGASSTKEARGVPAGAAALCGWGRRWAGLNPRVCEMRFAAGVAGLVGFITLSAKRVAQRCAGAGP